MTSDAGPDHAEGAPGGVGGRPSANGSDKAIPGDTAPDGTIPGDVESAGVEPTGAARSVGHTPDRRSRRAAAIAAAALFAAVGIILAVTTPWHPLPGDVPGGAVAPDPARDFTAKEIARSRAFDAALNPPAYLDLIVGLAVVLALGLTPLGARFIAWCTAFLGDDRQTPAAPDGTPQSAGRRSGRRSIRVRRTLRLVVAVLAVTTLLRLAGLPFDAWREGVLRRYGLSTQAWPAWLLDQAKSLAVGWVTWLIVVLLLYWLMRRLPRYWWTGAAAGAFLLVVAASFAYPVVVEPVFNKFTSLPAGQLRTDLLQMAARDGVPVEDVLVADASRRTTALNAYVSGFGSTRRIVLYDTLLRSTPRPQIEAIVAHELGHAKHKDVLNGTLIGALSVADAVCLLYLLLSSPRLLRRAGVRESADLRSVALLLAVIAVLTQLGGPVQQLISRHIEARADAHSLNLTRDPKTFTAMQHELSVRNLSDLDPNPVEYFLWFSHPSGPQRIAMARDWARLHHVPEP